MARIYIQQNVTQDRDTGHLVNVKLWTQGWHYMCASVRFYSPTRTSIKVIFTNPVTGYKTKPSRHPSVSCCTEQLQLFVIRGVLHMPVRTSTLWWIDRAKKKCNENQHDACWVTLIATGVIVNQQGHYVTSTNKCKFPSDRSVILRMRTFINKWKNNTWSSFILMQLAGLNFKNIRQGGALVISHNMFRISSHGLS